MLSGGSFLSSLNMEKKHKGPKISVFADAFGQAGTIRWMVDYESLASLETAQAGILGDGEYFQRLREAEAKGLFMPGDIEDVVMRAM